MRAVRIVDQRISLLSREKHASRQPPLCPDSVARAHLLASPKSEHSGGDSGKTRAFPYKFALRRHANVKIREYGDAVGGMVHASVGSDAVASCGCRDGINMLATILILVPLVLVPLLPAAEPTRDCQLEVWRGKWVPQ